MTGYVKDTPGDTPGDIQSTGVGPLRHYDSLDHRQSQEES